MKCNIFRKTIPSLLLAFTLMISSLPLAVFAEGGTEIRFGTVLCTTGDEIAVPVTIENNSGLAGFRLYVNYDATLDFLWAQQSAVLSAGTLVWQDNEENGRVCLIWYHTEAMQANGELFILHFKAQIPSKEDYRLTFTYQPEDILREDASPLPVSVIDGNVTITHNYSAQDKNTTHHWMKCSVCSKIDETTRKAHGYDNTCDTTCNECSFTRTITHNYSVQDKDSAGHWMKCSVCGAIDENTRKTHTYDNNCDTACNECGFTRTITHNFSIQEKNASEHWLKCSVCGTIDESTRETHKHDNACDPTCNECEVERQVPDHVYDDAEDLVCNECGFERPPYVPGDVDNDGDVDLDDAIYLLYYVNFSATYPVSQPVDFNGDSKEDLDDAIYLLYHVNFPNSYPLQ